MNHTELIRYIIEQKNHGVDKEQIFNGLIDNQKISGVAARQAVESIRWD